MEDFYRDQDYLSQTTFFGPQLKKLFGENKKLNPTDDMKSKEKRFWSRVEIGTLKKIIDFYKEDLLLFGYSVEDYFSQLEVAITVNL